MLNRDSVFDCAITMGFGALCMWLGNKRGHQDAAIEYERKDLHREILELRREIQEMKRLEDQND